MQWFRMYVELKDDPKMRQLKDKTFRVFIYLLCLASELNDDGNITLGLENVSWRLRLRCSTLKTSLVLLKKHRVLDFNEHVIVILNWSKRQYASDNAAENKRKQREKAKYHTPLSQDMSKDSPKTCPKNVSLQNRTDTEQNRTDTESHVDENHRQASELLYKKILSRNPNHKKPNLAEWDKHIKLLNVNDNKSINDILLVIDWCQDDPFWQNNILSTQKLRKQYDQLCLKMFAGSVRPKTKYDRNMEVAAKMIKRAQEENRNGKLRNIEQNTGEGVKSLTG